MGQEVDVLVSKMGAEQQQHRTLQEKVQNVTHEISGQIEADLKAEREERERSEDTLLTMLENTCNKIQELN